VTAAELEQLAALIAAKVAAAPRPLALTITQACDALGVSWDFWREYIEPEVRIVRRGRLVDREEPDDRRRRGGRRGQRKLVPVAELERWLEANAERLLDTGTPTLTASEIPATRWVRASRAPGRQAS
jgi:hypothetical protein